MKLINMKIADARAVLLKFLKSLAQLDWGKVNVVDMTPLGLVEITRSRW